MSYAKEFKAEEYTVPEFLLKDPAWEDVSWHNDMCPRWEHHGLGIAIWVDYTDASQREYEAGKQYMVCQLKKLGPDEYILEDGELFSTEDANQLQEYVSTYGAILYAEKVVDSLNLAITPFIDVQDEMATVLAMLKEELRLISK